MSPRLIGRRRSSVVMVEGQFLDHDEQHDDRKIGRDQRDPEHQAEIIAAQFHQDDRDKRPHHKTRDRKCQAQAKSGAPDLLGGEVRQECIPRRVANALAHSVDDAGRQDGNTVPAIGNIVLVIAESV